MLAFSLLSLEWLQEQLAGGVTEKDDLCREVEDLGELIPDIDSKVGKCNIK